VASGLVSFSLGTDTAGSGRVPAGFNNIVGWKPTPGVISTEGVVPACKSLDCVSVFALSSADAAVVASCIGSEETSIRWEHGFKFGVPRQLEFFGDSQYAALYAQAITRLQELGGTAVPFDYTPFMAAASLLYAGPWVAERTAAVGDFIENARPGAGIWPVTRDIILSGRKYSAVDAFNGQYELARLERRAMEEMSPVHFLLLPTAGTIYTVSDLEREPVLCNSNLGHYTNFVNFFRLCAIALPAGFRSDGLPFGITLVGHYRLDQGLLELGARWQRAVPLPLGRTASILPSPDHDPSMEEARCFVAVVGAHMSGLPLNHQLTERWGKLESITRTAPHYRLYALPGGPPQRPGLVRVTDGGAAIALEVWSLSAWRFGEFVAEIPSPLGLGTIELADGSTVQGFVCESYATATARDITEFGGWRAYLKSLS
jgi:allophanate hydrolase